MAANNVHVFSSAVRETLRIWPVLTLARQQGFGGRNSTDKEQWLCDSVEKIFIDNEHVYPDELEDFISEALYNEFNTIVQDGSLQEICSRLCAYYDMCTTNKVDVVLEEVKKLQATKSTVAAQRQVQQDDDDSDSSDGEDDNKEETNGESMDVDMPTAGESSKNNKDDNIDEDGWETVRRKKH